MFKGICIFDIKRRIKSEQAFSNDFIREFTVSVKNEPLSRSLCKMLLNTCWSRRTVTGAVFPSQNL
jgi:hypothetical protein